MTDGDNFAHLGSPRRIWAVAACSGAADRIERIHQAIAERFVVGDRLIYLGNYLGGVGSATTIDRILAFRTYLLAAPGMVPGDFAFLRGMQEEIWSKLLQIQFAPNPAEVLRWMLERGAADTLQSYAGDMREGIAAARDGALAMTRWTNGLREAVRRHPGHDKFMSVLRRAALTGRNGSGHLLFVHAGLDPSRPLGAQRDSFWWEAGGFSRIAEPFESFARIFRGADPAGHGPVLTGYTVTLDGGCGRGGKLLAAGIAPGGEIIDLIEA